MNTQEANLMESNHHYIEQTNSTDGTSEMPNQLEFQWLLDAESAVLLVAKHADSIIGPASERMKQYIPEEGWYYHTTKHVEVVVAMSEMIVQAMFSDTDKYPHLAQITPEVKEALQTIVRIVAEYHDLFLEQSDSEQHSADYMKQQIVTILDQVQHNVDTEKINILIEKMMEAIVCTKVDFGSFAQTRQLVQFHGVPESAKQNPLARILCQADLGYFGGEFGNYLFFSAGIAREIQKINPDAVSILSILDFFQDQLDVLSRYEFLDISQSLNDSFLQQRNSNVELLAEIIQELKNQILSESGKASIQDVTNKDLPSIENESEDLARFRKIFNLNDLDPRVYKVNLPSL